MKTISLALTQEILRSSARLATCLWIRRRDGNEYGFTTNSKTLTIGGVTYRPRASFAPTDIASQNNLDADDLQVDGFLDSVAITEDELRAGRWDDAEFRVFQVNWSNLAAGDKKDRRGHLGQCQVNVSTFTAELLGLMDALGTAITETTQAGCRANLGDARCTVDLTVGGRTVTGTIDTADGDFFTLHDSARTEADAFFDEGVIEFLDGDAIGLSYEVKSYVVGSWTTKTPMAYDVTGAAYTMHRGCRKRFDEDCVTTFDNAVNFRGEPHLRGSDLLLQVGRSQ